MRLEELGERLTDLAHIVYGILTVFAPWFIAFIMFIGFILYELDKDNILYNDLLEYLIGIGLGVVMYISTHNIL